MTMSVLTLLLLGAGTAAAAPEATATATPAAAPTAAPAATPSVPDAARPAYDRGVAALKAKDPKAARAAFEECLKLAPDTLSCRWELGWAAWQEADWATVVSTWELVAKVDPTYESIETSLPQARSQRDLAVAGAGARAAAPATIAPVGKAALRLRAVGDMMIGTAFPAGALPPDGGAGAFAEVDELLRDADLTLGNLEGPLCDTDQPSLKCANASSPGSCYAFRTPTSYAHWYKDAGFDVLSTANNHAGDFGEACRTQTEQALDAQGIRWSGRPGTTATQVVNGRKVGFAAFHTSPMTNDVNNLPAAVALVQQLAAENDVVIVMFHGGAEGSKAIHVPAGGETFYGENRGDLRVFTHALVDAGADLVVGAGPHVLRGMELYKDRLIAYSLGNFSTYGRFNLSGNQGLGLILEVQVAEDGRFVAGDLLGVRQVGQGTPVPDPANASADLVRTLTAGDFATWGVVVAQDGTIGAKK